MAELGIRELTMAALVALHLGLALVLGAAASLRWLIAPSDWWVRTWGQARVLHGIGAALGLIALLALVVLQAASMTDEGQAPSLAQLWLLISRTHFGHAWLIGLITWILTGALLHMAERGPLRALGLASLAVFILTRGVVSHAGAQGDFTVDVALDWIHLLLVALWVGIVIIGALQRMPPVGAPLADRVGALHWVERMSDTATLIIIGIGLTGLYKVWVGLGAVGSLRDYLFSDYGRALIVKLALVGVAAALGGLNKFKVLPALFLALKDDTDDGATWRGALVRALRIELVVLVGAVIAAAVLSSTEWPGSE